MTGIVITGRSVGYDLRGDGPVVVLCHSLGGDRGLYSAQADALAADHTVLAYDMRGHGETEVGDRPPSLDVLAEDLEELVDALCIGAAHYVGQSIGAMTLLRFAARNAQRPATYAVLDAVAHTDAAWDERYAARARHVEREGVGAEALELAERSLGATSRREDPRFTERYAAVLAASPPAGYAWACRALIGFDLRAELAAIRAPVLVAAGEEDVLTTPQHARRIAEAIPGAVLAAIPGSGHVPCLERPAEVTALVRRWIAEHPLEAA